MPAASSVAVTSPGPEPRAVQAHLRRAAQRDEPPWLHGEIARRMSERLAIVKLQPAVVIDWWSALGHSDGLGRHYPQARIERVEPTAALAQRSLQAGRRPWWSPSRWRGGPPVVWIEEQAPRDARAQLLWANMMLHWSVDPLATFTRWGAAVAEGGFVMFSCLGPDTVIELRALYRRLGWPDAGHAYIDMHDLGDAMVGAGFADPVMDMERLTLTWPDAEAALAELRGLGGNAAAGRFQGLRTPRWRERLLRELEAALAGPDGRLRLSFEIIYGHAFQPPPRLRVAAQTTIPVETLRTMARRGGRSIPSG